MLLPWYGRDTDVAGVVLSESWNAWQALSIVAVLLFAIGVTAIAVPAARMLWTPAAGFRADRLLVPLGLLGLALVLFRLIDMPIPDIDLVQGDRMDSGRGAGLFLALLATAGIAYGGRRAGSTEAQRRL
jgi:hypothetical protein